MERSLLLSLFIACALRGMPQVLSLDSVLRTVDAVHPELRMYDARIKAFDTYAEGARALDPPRVGAGFFMTPYNTMMWKPDGMGDPGMGSFMITAEQMIANARKRNANATYMLGMSKVDAEMQNAMRNELFSMAKRSYYEWLVLEKKKVVLAQSASLINYLVQAAEIRYTYGMDKLNAYYKAKAMLGDVQNMQLMTDLEIEQMRIMLNTAMARDKGVVFSIDTAFGPALSPQLSLDTALITERRSDLRVIDRNIDLLRYKQDVQRASLRPDFGIKYDHMVGFGTQPQQFSLMGMMTIPIAPWSSKMYKSTIAGLTPEMDALRESRNALVNETLGQLSLLRSQIGTKQQQLDLYDRVIVPAMRSNYETALLAYEQNTEELFMVLDAWQNLRMVQLARLDLLKDLYLLYATHDEQLEIR
ncbi:MAG: TolC family protein [Flavobacteriales bacterium]|nr:TolC family protein [Flavobacteriales bacterium]MBP6696038.1 TolC family protein [Flavobacteriales bacterium]